MELREGAIRQAAHPIEKDIRSGFEKQSEGDMPFLEVVKKIKELGLGTPIYKDPGDKEKEPFGIVVPVEKLNLETLQDTQGKNGEVLFLFSQGLAIIGTVPEGTLPFAGSFTRKIGGRKQYDIQARELNELRQKYGAMPDIPFVKDLLQKYGAMPDIPFVKDLLTNVLKTESGEEYIPARELLDSILRKVQPQEAGSLENKSSQPPYSENLKNIFMSIINKRLLSVRNVHTNDLDTKGIIGIEEKITGRRIDQNPDSIVHWIGNRANFIEWQKDKTPHDELAKRWREAVTSDEHDTAGTKTTENAVIDHGQGVVETETGEKSFPNLSSHNSR